MNQSRLTSLRESVSNTAIGFGLSLVMQWLVLVVMFGLPMHWMENIGFALIMTAVSIARGYIVRRWFEAKRQAFPISPFAHAVLAERARHHAVLGYSPKHDDNIPEGKLALGASAYAYSAGISPEGFARTTAPDWWPWSRGSWNPEGFRRDLIKSASMLLAEGEKLDRVKSEPVT